MKYNKIILKPLIQSGRAVHLQRVYQTMTILALLIYACTYVYYLSRVLTRVVGVVGVNEQKTNKWRARTKTPRQRERGRGLKAKDWNGRCQKNRKNSGG